MMTRQLRSLGLAGGLALAAVATAADGSPAPAPTKATAGTATVATAADANCVVIAYWLGGGAARRQGVTNQLLNLGATGRPQLTDEAAVRLTEGARVLATLARDQAASKPPPGAEVANDDLVAALAA